MGWAVASLVDSSIQRGLCFLHRRQSPSGYFRTLTSRMINLRNPVDDPTLFTTALIMYSLSFFPKHQVVDITEPASSFLLGEMGTPGFWRYWRSDHLRKISIDLDDTICVSLALFRSGIAFPDNRERLLANRDGEGRFYTWLFDEKLGSFDCDIPAKHHKNVDPVVNANALAWLGYREETRAAIDYVTDWIQSDNDCCRKLYYYVDTLSLYYAASRALYLGVQPLERIREQIARSVALRLWYSPEWNALLSALAVASLLNLNVESEVIRILIGKVLQDQREDGSWPAIAMYCGPASFYGSEELTTGFCLEALERFRQINKWG